MRAFSDLRKHTVGLFNTKEQTLCTAVVIDDYHLLTAAHCALSPIDDYLVIFDTALHEASPVDTIDHIDLHKDYDRLALFDRADLALIEITHPLPSHYEPVENFEFTDSLDAGVPLWVVGFGNYQTEEPRGSGILRWAIVDLTDPRYSSSEFSVNQESGFGVCRGDSGGPAFIKTSEGIYLAGITSRGTPDCTQSIFTSGAFIKTFLDSVLKRP